MELLPAGPEAAGSEQLYPMGASFGDEWAESGQGCLEAERQMGAPVLGTGLAQFRGETIEKAAIREWQGGCEASVSKTLNRALCVPNRAAA